MAGLQVAAVSDARQAPPGVSACLTASLLMQLQNGGLASLIVNYLNRERRDHYASLLVEHGLLVALQPTVENLTRHAKPGREYLVEPGELQAWVRGLGMEVLVAREGWTDENRHEAVVIGKRPPRAITNEPDRDESAPSLGPYR